MTRHAAIILATAHRRRLLDLCLARLCAQAVPEGWTYTVYVSGTAEDFGRAVVAKHAATLAGACTTVRWAQAPTDLIGHKLRACVEAADAGGAELILWVGDDDLQPLTRLGAAIEAHVAGARASGVKGYWYLDTHSGRIAWWEGGYRWYGAGVALPTVAWRRIGQRVLPGEVGSEVQTVPDPAAWDIERAAEPWLYNRTWLHPAHVVAAHRKVGKGIVCLCHGRNLTSRPFPEKGKLAGERVPIEAPDGSIHGYFPQWIGSFRVMGMGNIDDPPPGFPDYPELRDLVREARGAGRGVGIAAARARP